MKSLLIGLFKRAATVDNCGKCKSITTLWAANSIH